MDIRHINEYDYNLVKDFLLSVKTIKDIDEDVLKNAMIVVDNNDILGAVSYEKFGISGLIRYFVFKRNLTNDTVVSLFKMLEETAYDDYIKDIYCVVNNGHIEELFNELGFLKEKYKMLFIDESDFDLEGNSHAFIMKRQIRENICC